MKQHVTAEDVLKDIEFELAQGAISRDDLSQSIRAVRQYHNRLRTDTLPSIANDRDREVIGKLFQVNDMLLTLLQETAVAINGLHLSTKNVLRETYSPTSHMLVEETEYLHVADRLTAIENATSPRALAVELDIRSSSTGFLGTLLNRARSALHNVALFYVRKLASQQTTVNQTLGDYLKLVIVQVSELNKHVQGLGQHTVDSDTLENNVDSAGQ